MAEYEFVTVWQVDAPIQPVWEAIYDARRYPEWWKSVQSVEELEPGDEDGLGSVHRYHWKTRLPYELTFDMRATRVERPTLLEGHATGELEGVGLWQLSEDGRSTTVQYTWKVRTTKTWMNLLAPLARPLFVWNHDAVMGDGAEGLARLLKAEVVTVQ